MPTEIIILVLQIILEAIKGQAPEVKAELSKMFLEDLKAWRSFWEKMFKPNVL